MAVKKKGTKRIKAGTAKTTSKKSVAVNFLGVEAGRRRSVRIPEGNYKARVKSVESTDTKAGDSMVVWIFEIMEHEKFDGQQFYYNSVLTPKALWNFRAVLEAIGVRIKDSTMNIPLDRLVGRTCGIEIVDGEYDGKTRSEINDIFPEALLEEEDEEEGEEEDEDDWDDGVDEVDEEDDEDDEDDDEEDDDWEDEDEDDEEEDDEPDEDTVRSYGIKDLRNYAREQGVYKKGMKKSDILDVLFEDEEEDDEFEDWDEDEDGEEEIDLDEDEL